MTKKNMQVKNISNELVLSYFSESNRVVNVIKLLQIDHDIPFKVALRKIERMAGVGILEYGCSINYVWIVKK